MFSADDVQARLKQTPFVPLRIVSTSGQTYNVPHPDLVLVGRRYIIIGTPSNENPTQFEAESRVAVLHIADLQDMPHGVAPQSNGESG